MKRKEIWRVRTEYVSWAVLLSPEAWSGIPLEHCWIEGRSAYALDAEFISVEGSMIHLKMANGATIPVPLAIVGQDERRRVQSLNHGDGSTTPPPTAACA